MDAATCITTRKSIRAFKRDPVPPEILRGIFDTARWSPSYKNSQPWEVVVLSGEKRRALTKKLISLFESGSPPTPDLPPPESWPPSEQARIDHLYRIRAEATGIDLNDPEVVKKSRKANFSFYGAPHAVYLFQENSLSPWSLFDLGIFAQSVMLAAHAKGLGTVPQAFATDYAAEIKDFLGIDKGKRLVIGLSVGYPNNDAPANKLRTDRSPVDEFVSFL